MNITNKLFAKSKLLLFFLIIQQFSLHTIYADNEVKFKTVVIDAGHGGKDSGALGKNMMEKDLTLSIALKVGNYIKEYMPEVKVVYTRDEDIFVPLDERAEIANKAKADLFVSIHGNSISKPEIHGAETFVLGLHRSDENLEVAKKENAVIILEDDYTTKYEGFDPNQPESYIIFELMQNVYLDQSILAASLVQEQFEKRVGRNNRGVKQAGFLVLRKTAMPGILVEVGFLSNEKEERYLMSDDGQSYLASGIFRAIRDYRDRFEERTNLTTVRKTEENKKHDEISKLLNINVEPEIKTIYRIQIASSGYKVEGNHEILSKFNDVWIYEENNIYRYTTGYAYSYQDIAKQLVEVRKIIPDCFVIAFKDNKRVPVSSTQ